MLKWHKKTREVVAKRLMESTNSNKKLQTILTRVEAQLKNSKVSIKSKENKIEEPRNYWKLNTNKSKI